MEKRNLWIGITAILAILFAAVLFIGNGKLTSLKQQEKKNAGTIAELTSELEGLQASAGKEAPVEIPPEEQEAIVNSAAELGNKVAEYQNAYATLSASKDKDAFNGNVEAMDACLGEDAKGARVPWYSGGISGTWSFITDGTFHGTSRNVLWLCQSEKGELLSYATAVYDSEAGVFTDVHYEMSMLAGNSVTSSGDQSLSSDIDVNKVNDMAQDIANADAPDERELTDDESADVKESQQKLKEMMEGK